MVLQTAETANSLKQFPLQQQQPKHHPAWTVYVKNLKIYQFTEVSTAHTMPLEVIAIPIHKCCLAFFVQGCCSTSQLLSAVEGQVRAARTGHSKALCVVAYASQGAGSPCVLKQVLP